MRRDEILDLILLEADGGLSPLETARLERAIAGDPTLQLDCESIHCAWHEVQSRGRSVAMRGEVAPRDVGDAGIDAPGEPYDDAVLDADSRSLATTSTRQPPNNRDYAPAPARRRRKSPRRPR